MRIAFVAKHTPIANQDEGAITYALRQLGHEVVCIEEMADSYDEANTCDFALISHNWRKIDQVETIKCFKAFWFFDLVEHEYMPHRHLEHLLKLQRLCDIGFCTDGDWAAKNKNIYYLPQGADERCLHTITNPIKSINVLYAGGLLYPPDRKLQFRYMKRMLGSDFHSLTHPQEWVYREEFAALIARTRIVLAMLKPVKDFYHSNRVYVVAGFGGCLLHPYTRGLAEEFKDGETILYYRSWEQAVAIIREVLKNKSYRQIGTNAARLVAAKHTYRHRCQRLLEVVRSYV